MESAPKKWRGILSGILQSGYSVGYLLAAIVARFVLPVWGWRPMFWLGGVPALLALYIRARVPESEAWKKHRATSVGAVLKTAANEWKLFAYLIFLMTFMMFLSHGTQDLYPDFLVHDRHLTAATASTVAVIYTIGMMVGAVFFGELSERIGRRRSVLCALGLSLAVIPLWAFGGTVVVLVAGSFLMQAGVQGAWGIMPAHLNELAPDAARGLMPGLVYQLGILFAAPTNTLEYALRDHLSYGWAIAAFEIVTISMIAITIVFGHERRGRQFVGHVVAAPPG
jgi:SHS family lactate transporter-like MFS transporter